MSFAIKVKEVSIYIQNATSFVSDKKSSDAPEADNQFFPRRFFFSKFGQQYPSPPPHPSLHFLSICTKTSLPCLYYI